MRLSRTLQMATAILLGTLIFIPAHAVTINIPTDVATITEGLTVASLGDTLLVAPGVYLEHDLVITTGICLRGATGDPVDVIIDAQQQGRVITCAHLTDMVRIEALTLTGGLSTLETTGRNMGGGLIIEAALAQVRNCHIIDNEAEMEGGGLACDDGASALITGCVIAGNRSVDGAGVACRASSPLLENCIIANNDGLVWGGALFCRSGSNPRVVGCTIVGNEAHFGAGIWAVDGPNIVVENSIIAFGLDGEGIFAYDNPSYPSEINLICCNVFGNQSGGYGGTTPDQTGIDGNIAEDPGFCDWENYDYTLDASSPCLPANNGCNMLMGALGQGCDLTSAVDDDLPMATRIVGNIPNPFNPLTTINFECRNPGQVQLAVYDLSGHRVALLVNGWLAAGHHEEAWNGRDASGRLVAAGQYLVRLKTTDGIDTQKVMLAK
jgi:hypothetical protein